MEKVMNMKVKLATLAALVCTGLVCGSASAQTQVGPVAISQVSAGWYTDSMAVSTALPVANPANCPNGNGYRILAENGGYKTILATTLTAVSAGQKVTIAINNSQCTSDGWPMIIGMNINP
jgi:hypothetical protein